MGDKKEMANLPRYKSDEYNVNFECKIKKSDWIAKFKRDGELNSETEVRIRKCSGYPSYLCVDWKRQTAQGTEDVNLIVIYPTDGFLEFLDKFLEKKGVIEKYWRTTYGTIFATSKLCEKDPDRFKELVRKAENISELLIAAGFRD